MVQVQSPSRLIPAPGTGIQYRHTIYQENSSDLNRNSTIEFRNKIDYLNGFRGRFARFFETVGKSWHNPESYNYYVFCVFFLFFMSSLTTVENKSFISPLAVRYHSHSYSLTLGVSEIFWFDQFLYEPSRLVCAQLSRKELILISPSPLIVQSALPGLCVGGCFFGFVL